ncbi:MAG TPA: S8 family peptidase [Vicinamibacterales bacterium]|nr:S8 family peptidase [Vicinamibacterales bacterium]
MIRWTGKYGGRLALTLVFLIGLSGPALAQLLPVPGPHAKLDKILNERVNRPGSSKVIVMLRPGSDVSAEVRRAGGKVGRKLSIINGHAVELPNAALRRMADNPMVASIHADRPTGGEMNRVGVTVGARAVQQDMGYDGAGIGVAVVDSGITSWHDDLTYSGTSTAVRTVNGQRVAAFVDFVQGRSSTYDDHGHGTHVSGIIAGNGYDTRGARAGIAPAAHLVGLKVLDHQGRGRISDVIAALGWVVQNRSAYNIRVANLSVGAAVTESYNTDPLTLAAKQAVQAGIVVVTAAGNLGKNALGQPQYGGITAPGNAPWVLTVGASSTQGTPTRVDDVIALYSSRGPTAIDYGAKPDLVAPGTGVVSLSDPTSTLYSTKSAYLLKGTVATAYKPYLSLSGTSMAAPVVSGTVALMLQANPNLTPNMVKAILQFTAQKYSYNTMTQGAGFLNTRGATQLARFFATAQPGSTFAMPRVWSKQVIWGNHRIGGGVIRPNTNAWDLTTVWGSFMDGDGENIVWGTMCDDPCENIVWGSFDLLDGENIVWGTLFDDFGENIVWGTFLDLHLNIVWGTLWNEENVVWGSDCGGADCENMVWGTFDLLDSENIVWGTLDFGENVVWGSGGVVDGTVWGTSSEADNVTWGCSGEETPLFDDPELDPAVYDPASFDSLFEGAADTSSTTVTEPVTTTELTEPVTTTTITTESSTLSTTTSVTTTVTGILGGGL